MTRAAIVMNPSFFEIKLMILVRLDVVARAARLRSAQQRTVGHDLHI
jgi:hypothetical protein